ncbi:MAG: ABC transporter permease, partial [Candidatus Promineifilaceae bacterium]
MSKLLNIALKDLRIEFSTPLALLTFILLPAVFTVIFAGRFATDDGSGPVGIGLMVVDQDQSEFSAELITQLEQSDATNPNVMTLADAETAFADGSTALLVIPDRFGALVGKGNSAELELRLQPNDTNGVVVGQAVQAAVSNLSRSLAIAAESTEALAAEGVFATGEERQAYFD